MDAAATGGAAPAAEVAEPPPADGAVAADVPAQEQPAAAAAAQPGQPEPPRALRCIDPTHAGSQLGVTCPVCVEAPPDAEVEEYVITGEEGKKNGEKLLRKQVLLLLEWRSPPHREQLARAPATAARLEAEGGADPLLLRALRTKDSTVLRKRHLLTLCRAWGYRADCWVRRADAVTSAGGALPAPDALSPLGSYAAAGAAAAGAADHVAPPVSAFIADVNFLSQFATPQRLSAHVKRMFERSREATRTLACIPSARALALAGAPLGFITGDLLRKNEALVPFNQGALAICRSHLHTVNTWLLRSDADARVEAFRALQGQEDPVEQMLGFSKAVIATAMSNLRMSEAAAVVERGGTLLPVEAAWFGDLRARNEANIGALAQADALVAVYRLGRFDAYLALGKAVIEELTEEAAAHGAGFNERLAWIAQVLAQREAVGALNAAEVAASSRLPGYLASASSRNENAKPPMVDGGDVAARKAGEVLMQLAAAAAASAAGASAVGAGQHRHGSGGGAAAAEAQQDLGDLVAALLARGSGS